MASAPGSTGATPPAALANQRESPPRRGLGSSLLPFAVSYSAGCGAFGSARPYFREEPTVLVQASITLLSPSPPLPMTPMDAARQALFQARVSGEWGGRIQARVSRLWVVLIFD